MPLPLPILHLTLCTEPSGSIITISSFEEGEESDDDESEVEEGEDSFVAEVPSAGTTASVDCQFFFCD